MDSIKSKHHFYQLVFFLTYIFSFVCLFLFFYIQNYIFLYILCICLLIEGMILYVNNQEQVKSFKYLIHQVEGILEQKTFPIIDGEGEISLLSHKLFMLSNRYYSLIETMKAEQIQLKDYIEDISHQLKTPITSMRLNEELLLETIKDESQHNKLMMIYQQTIKINQLVNDLLTLALLDSHSITFHFQDNTIEALIDSVEENLEHLLIKNHMTLHLTGKSIQILCDYKWFGEALENIIKNCIEKNRDDSIEIEASQNESLVKLIIKDHGKGFDDEDILHLFERFYRGQNPQGEGIGIGLALAKEIIEEHHGFIRVYNDHGAVFEITIPRILAKKKI